VTKRDRIDWLLTAINAVQDLVQPKLEARRKDNESGPQRERDEELQICLEELRVAAEELISLRDRVAVERQRYAELFDFAPEPYLETDRHGNVREANRAAAALLKCDPEYLLGKPLAVYLPEDSRKVFRARLHELANDDAGEAVEFDTTMQPREADAVRVAVRASAARDVNGRVSGARWLLRPSRARLDAPGVSVPDRADAAGESD